VRAIDSSIFNGTISKTNASWAQNSQRRCSAPSPATILVFKGRGNRRGGGSTQKTTGNFPTLNLGRERGHSTFSEEEKVESPLSARPINACPFRKAGVNKSEKHYKLVSPENVTEEDLKNYRSRMSE
jgi:hypothetical protein